MLKFLDFRFVYLFQETNTLLNFFDRRDEKIGISNVPSRRRKEVEDTMKGRGLKIKFAVMVFFAERHEKRLHYFLRYRKEYKKDIDGGTEFFDLEWYHILFTWIYLVFVSLVQFSAIAFLIIFITKQLQIC